jgi:hypothetical protein
MLNGTIIEQAWVIYNLEYALSHHGTDMEIKYKEMALLQEVLSVKHYWKQK